MNERFWEQPCTCGPGPTPLLCWWWGAPCRPCTRTSTAAGLHEGSGDLHTEMRGPDTTGQEVCAMPGRRSHGFSLRESGFVQGWPEGGAGPHGRNQGAGGPNSGPPHPHCESLGKFFLWRLHWRLE